MPDMRHNPDLDEAMGMGTPKAPTPTPPPSAFDDTLMAAIDRLTAAVGQLAAHRPQPSPQQTAPGRPAADGGQTLNVAPLAASMTTLTGAVNRLNTTMQGQAAGQGAHVIAQQAAANRTAGPRGGRGKKAGRPGWLMRKLYAVSGQNRAGRFGRYLHKTSRKGAAGTGAGKAAGTAGVVLMAAGALAEFSKKVKEGTDRLTEINRQYAQVSAQMALVMAQRDIREMQRNQRVGDATADSAKALADAEQKRKDSGQNLEIVGNKVSNYVQAGLNEVVAAVVSVPDKIIGYLNRIITGKDLKKKEDEPTTGSEMLDAARQDYERQNARHAPWFTRKPM